MKVLNKESLNSIILFIGFLLLIFGVRVYVIQSYSGFTPYYDDWDMAKILFDYKTQGVDLKALATPWNGHMVLWSKLLNFILFEINQIQWDPQLHMLINAIVWSFTGAFLIIIIANYFTQINRSVLIAFVLALWLFPLSVENAIWGVQTHSYLMVFFIISALWFAAARPMTYSWWLGLGLAFAASLTMGGGAFVSIAIFAVALFKLLISKERDDTFKEQLGILFILAVFCLALLYYSSHDHANYTARNFADFFKTLLLTLAFPIPNKPIMSIIWLLPIVLLMFKTMMLRSLNNRLVIFTLTLFACTMGIAIAIAYVRSQGGIGPAYRYYDFLQLYFFSSLLALLILQSPKYEINRHVNTIIVFCWFICSFFALMYQLDTLDRYNKKLDQTRTMQSEVLRKYMITADPSRLQKYEIGHAYLAYPHPDRFHNYVQEFVSIDMMPHQLQIHAPLNIANTRSAFGLNNTVIPSENMRAEAYWGEPSIGSFNRSLGGMRATGTYISELITTHRDYLMIPIIGYLGHAGLRLKLVDEVTGEETYITPLETGSEFAEKWRPHYVKTPANQFRLVAEDTNPELWFGFARPRTVGRLSKLTAWLLKQYSWIWQIGLLLIFISSRQRIIETLKPKKLNHQ